MKEKFIGGKGFDLWYLWHAVTPETRWDPPKTRSFSCCRWAASPIRGTGKTLVCSISPLTDIPSTATPEAILALLKFSGWDARFRAKLKRPDRFY